MGRGSSQHGGGGVVSMGEGEWSVWGRGSGRHGVEE